MSAKLPYKIPGTEKGKIEFLCNLLGTSYSKFSKYPNHIVIEALTGIVVYHQLGHIERTKYRTKRKKHSQIRQI